MTVYVDYPGDDRYMVQGVTEMISGPSWKQVRQLMFFNGGAMIDGDTIYLSMFSSATPSWDDYSFSGIHLIQLNTTSLGGSFWEMRSGHNNVGQGGGSTEWYLEGTLTKVDCP